MSPGQRPRGSLLQGILRAHLAWMCVIRSQKREDRHPEQRVPRRKELEGQTGWRTIHLGLWGVRGLWDIQVKGLSSLWVVGSGWSPGDVWTGDKKFKSRQYIDGNQICGTAELT